MRLRESLIQEAFDVRRPVEDLPTHPNPQGTRLLPPVSLGVQGTGREPQVVRSLLKREQRFRHSLRPHPRPGLSIQHGRCHSEDRESQQSRKESRKVDWPGRPTRLAGICRESPSAERVPRSHVHISRQGKTPEANPPHKGEVTGASPFPFRPVVANRWPRRLPPHDAV